MQDINNSLVDDGKVDKEKIGGSNYFWSFPGKEDRLLQIDLEKDEEKIKAAEARVVDARAKLADAKRGREDEGGDRPKKLARLAELDKEKKALTAELESLKENDPQALADLEKELKFVVEGANRWTDNIFTVSFSIDIQKNPFTRLQIIIGHMARYLFSFLNLFSLNSLTFPYAPSWI